jgi:hypothetical protein
MQKKGYYTDFTQPEDSEKIEFDFSTNISMLGKMNLVKKTVERCIIDEHFFSNLLPVIFDYHIIMYFAAIDLSDIEANDYDLTIQKYVFINDYVVELSESFETYLGKWDVQSTSTSKELSNLIGLLQ